MEFKNVSYCFALCLLTAVQCFAQIIKTPANSLLIKKGATLSVDGLSLTALNEDFAFNENGIYVSADPIVGNPGQSIARVYTFLDEVTFTGIIKMSYLPSELNGNGEADLQLSFGRPDIGFSVPFNSSIVNQAMHNLQETVIDKTFQYITATTSGSVLPVKLINFTAMANEKHVLIAWTTSEETNSDYFEVQHSVDGKEWKAIGRVEASGESDVDKTYSYEHNGPIPGENLYRLKMMDQDGTFAYSRIRIVKMDVESVFSFHPNPVSDLLKIDVADWSSLKNIKVSNASGLTVAELNELQITNLSEKAINVRKFPSGMYLIQVTHKDGTVKNGKVFKN
jgi:hypothetical protein